MKPHADSLCSDCFFFADGACPRFLAAVEADEVTPEDAVIVSCGGYETVNPPQATVPTGTGEDVAHSS